MDSIGRRHPTSSGGRRPQNRTTVVELTTGTTGAARVRSITFSPAGDLIFAPIAASLIAAISAVHTGAVTRTERRTAIGKSTGAALNVSLEILM
jgi:hypothetical protein